MFTSSAILQQQAFQIPLCGFPSTGCSSKLPAERRNEGVERVEGSEDQERHRYDEDALDNVEARCYLSSCWGRGRASSLPESLPSRPDRSAYTAFEPTHTHTNCKIPFPQHFQTENFRKHLVTTVSAPHLSSPLGSEWTGSSAVGHRPHGPGQLGGAAAGEEHLDPDHKHTITRRL